MSPLALNALYALWFWGLAQAAPVFWECEDAFAQCKETCAINHGIEGIAGVRLNSCLSACLTTVQGCRERSKREAASAPTGPKAWEKTPEPVNPPAPRQAPASEPTRMPPSPPPPREEVGGMPSSPPLSPPSSPPPREEEGRASPPPPPQPREEEGRTPPPREETWRPWTPPPEKKPAGRERPIDEWKPR